MQEVEAFHLIEDKLEVWRASRVASSTRLDALEIITGEDTSFPPFHLVWQINEPFLSVKEVFISAQWLDQMGQTHTVSVRTMLSVYADHEADLTSDFDYH